MRIFQRVHSKLNWSKQKYFALILGIVVIGYTASAIYHVYKPLPEGLDYTGKLHYSDAQFFSDQTYMDAQGQQQQDHQIFDEMLKLIQQAKTTIVLDLFLFNQQVGQSKLIQRPLTEQLTQALVQKKRQNPNIQITFITDPINSVYGGIAPAQYRQLRKVGVDVVETDLTPLRASNPLWSGMWYIYCQNLGNNPEKGWLTNPLGGDKVTLRSYLQLANFKANHRKTLVVDTDQGWKSMISSANPHDGSSRHSNVAVVVSGAVVSDILKTEQSVTQFSGGDIPLVLLAENKPQALTPQVQVLTEEAIYQAVLDLIKNTKTNEQLDLMMFYLSERHIVTALKEAQQRGVKVRVLLDPNKDAFGHQKNGIPNRQTASELHAAGVPVRWCDTHGEQCHSKMIMKTNGTQAQIILGSANFTARNLKNYNLETDVHLVGKVQAPVFQDAQNYFNTAWSNLNGRQMSVDYAKYADESKVKYWTYRFMEWSGLSTF